MDEKRDCRYCKYAGCESPKSSAVYCYLDTEERIFKPKKDAETCHFFKYDNVFPKY